MPNDIITMDETPERPGGRERPPERSASPSAPEGPASVVQIKQLEASRPRPQLLLTYSPLGPVVQEVNPHETVRKNAEIDRDVAKFKERLATRKGKAREAFKLAKDYKGEREI